MRYRSHSSAPSSLHSSVQATVLNRFGDVTRLDILRACEIRDGAADFEHAAVSPGAEAQPVDGVLQELFGIVFEQAVTLDIAGAHLRIAVNVSLVEPL